MRNKRLEAGLRCVVRGTKLWARTYVYGRADLYLGDMKTVQKARAVADETDALNGLDPRDWPPYDRELTP